MPNAKVIIAVLGIVCGLIGLIWSNVQVASAGVLFASTAHLIPAGS